MQTIFAFQSGGAWRIKTFSNYRKLRRWCICKNQFPITYSLCSRVRNKKKILKAHFDILHENEIKTNINQENTVNVLKTFSLSHQTYLNNEMKIKKKLVISNKYSCMKIFVEFFMCIDDDATIIMCMHCKIMMMIFTLNFFLFVAYKNIFATVHNRCWPEALKHIHAR